MKNNMFSYKGYYATVEFDVKKMTLRGTIHGIKDRVTFKAGYYWNYINKIRSKMCDRTPKARQIAGIQRT